MCGGDGRGEGGSVENRIYYCQGAKLPVLQKNQYLHFAIAKEDANNDLFVVIKVRATIYLAGYAS
jgi:hypothetical protein